MHPFRDVVVAGVHNPRQARVLEGETSLSVAIDATLGALADAGLDVRDVDGITGSLSSDLTYELGLGPVWQSASALGIPAVMEAAAQIATGLSDVVVVAAGQAGVYTERASTAPWTRPNHEFVAPYGMFTAAEFALIARRHMHMYGTTAEQMATVAATVRNNGHVHPDAIYAGRGPFTVDDILASRMVADPFHLLECAMTSEGGCAIVLARADRVPDLPHAPVWILGGSTDRIGPSYRHAPAWDLRGRDPDGIPNGYVGRRAARRAFATAGLGPDDVDVCELYDPFSFEIIRQFEAFGFCGEGEGGPFVMDGVIGPGGRFPITTDGGLMAFSHGGQTSQLLQRVIRGVQQLRGTCTTMQVEGAEVALCSGGGAGALFNDVLLLGRERP
ncbi:MAG: thiolase family protein [Actinomycetota bacterium]